MQTFKLLPHDTVMLLQPVLVKNFGKSGALLLSQLHYWLTKKDSLGCDHQGNRWIYNTAEEWAAQLQLSARYIRHLFAELTKLGIVKVKKLHKIKSVRTNYYSIDYDRLNDFIGTANAENSDSHAEKITAPLGTNNLMYNDKKTTIKDFNKSEAFLKNPDVVEQVNSNLANPQQTSEKSQVKQVKNLKLKSEKILEAKILAAVNATEVLQISASPPTPNNLEASINEAVVLPGELAVKTSTVQEMLKVWNDSFAGKAETKLSKDLAAMLVAAFKSKFANNITNWQNYCEQLRSSSYLMEDAFKLTIGWALKFRTIDRIWAGELGVKFKKTEDGVKDNSVQFDDTQIKQMIEALPESNISKGLRHKVAQAVGYAVYFSWFHQAKFCEAGGKIRLVAPNAFVAQYWETHFDWLMKD